MLGLAEGVHRDELIPPFPVHPGDQLAGRRQKQQNPSRPCASSGLLSGAVAPLLCARLDGFSGIDEYFIYFASTLSTHRGVELTSPRSKVTRSAPEPDTSAAEYVLLVRPGGREKP